MDILFALFLIASISVITHGQFNLTTKIQTTNTNGIPIEFDIDTSPFEKIGQKYYYIENETTLNWYNAGNKCREIGGYLWNIESAEEFNEVIPYLKGNASNVFYWTSGYDLGQQGVYISSTTGIPVTYLSWGEGEPNNARGLEHCIELRHSADRLMNDARCISLNYYVCEKNNPITLSITVW